MLAPVGPLRAGFRPPALAPLRFAAAVGPPSLRGFARRPWRRRCAVAVTAPACWLGLSAPALARRSGGSRPPSASLRSALRRGPARAAYARPVGCARPWAAPGLLRFALRAAAGSRCPPWAARPRPGPPPPPPRWGCAALALAAPAGGPLAGLRPASSGPRPPGVGGVGLAACGRRWLLSQQSALRRCGIQSGVALLRPGFAGPAYMRAAALSHLLTRHTACPPMHTASLPLADHAEAPPGPLPDRDSGASA